MTKKTAPSRNLPEVALHVVHDDDVRVTGACSCACNVPEGDEVSLAIELTTLLYTDVGSGLFVDDAVNCNPAWILPLLKMKNK